jgi:hypothetical protein
MYYVRYVHDVLTYVQNSMWVIVGYRWQLLYVGLSRAGDCQKRIFLATFVVAKLPKVVIGSDFEK